MHRMLRGDESVKGIIVPRVKRIPVGLDEIAEIPAFYKDGVIEMLKRHTLLSIVKTKQCQL